MLREAIALFVPIVPSVRILRRIGLLRVALAFVLLFSGAAFAETVAPPVENGAEAVSAPTGESAGTPVPLAEALTGPAHHEYEAGRLLFQDGDYAGAYAKFHLAYQLSKDPRLLWNQAVCEKEQRHYARATGLIERYLKEGAGLIEPDKRRDAESILAALKQFSSQVELKGAPEGATLEIDGLSWGRLPLSAPLYLDVGRHILLIESAGFRPFRQTIEVPGASTLRVPVRMVPEATPSELRIVVHPASATIRIDGVIVGTGHWEGPIAPGPHRIAFAASGRTSVERRIEVIQSRQHALDVQLEAQKKAKVWPWLVAGAVVVAAGAVGGTVWAIENPVMVPPQGSLGGVDARQR
jgi:hypothetical protein